MNLNQVTIFSDKTNELVEFYKKLGLKLIVDSLPRYARMECPDGDSTLSVHSTDAAPAGSVVWGLSISGERSSRCCTVTE